MVPSPRSSLQTAIRAYIHTTIHTKGYTQMMLGRSGRESRFSGRRLVTCAQLPIRPAFIAAWCISLPSTGSVLCI